MKTTRIADRFLRAVDRLPGRLRAGVAAFAYASMCLAPTVAMADDIDVYTKAVAAGGGGASVVIFNADTSASMKYSYKQKEANNAQDMLPAADASAMPTSLLDQRWYMLGDAMMTQVTSLSGAFKVGIVGDDGDAGTNPGNSGKVYQQALPLSGGTGAPPAPPGTPASGVIDLPITSALDDAIQPRSTDPVSYGDWYLAFGYGWGGSGWSSHLTLPFTGKWNSSGAAATPYPASYTYDWINGTGAIAFDYYHTSSTDSTQIFYLDSAAGDTVLYVLGWKYDPVTAMWTFQNMTTGPMPSPNDDRASASTTCPADVLTKTTTSGSTTTTSTVTLTWTLAGTTCSHTCLSTEITKSTGSPKWSFSPASPCDGHTVGSVVTKAATVVTANTNSTVSLTGLQAGYWYQVIAATKTAGVTGNFTLNLQYPNNGALGGYVGGSSSGSASSRVGLVFRNAQVPQGAQIDRAWIQFQSYSDNAGAIQIEPRLDSALNAAGFTSGTLFSRSWWNGDYQNMPAWTYNERDANTRVDVKDLVQEKVNTTGWCGQNMVFVFTDDQTVYDWTRMRLAYSYESATSWGGASAIPTLHIEWTRDGDTAATSSCGVPIVKTYGINTNTSDVYQDAGGNVWYDSTTLPVASGNKVGLRFSLMDIPQGAVVTDAKLIVTAAANAAPTQWLIKGIDAGLTPPFLATTSYLDSLSTLSSVVAWTPPAWTAGNQFTVSSPAFTALVQSMINNAAWEYDGTMGFLIEGTGGAQPLYAWEQTASGLNEVSRGQFGTKSAQLVITLASNTAFPTGTTHRRDVANWIMSYVPTGHTAMAGSLNTVVDYVKGRIAGVPPPVMASGSCANNVNITASDLMENPIDYNAVPAIDTRVTTQTGAGCGHNASTAWPCFYSLLSALYEPDKYGAFGQAADGNYYSMRSYTIGMGATAQTGGGNLRAGANKGGGDYYSAANAGELIKLFHDIIKTVADSGATIATPGVAVNALNKFEHLDELYYSLFKPQVQSDWRGNLKRYRLKNDEIVDTAGVPAVGTLTQTFSSTAYSWWSTQLDGAQVIGGGMADHFTQPDTRKLFTWKGTYGTSMNESLYDAAAPMDGAGAESVTSLNTSFTPDELGVPLGGAPAGWVGGWNEQTSMKVALDFLRGGTNSLQVSSVGSTIHGSPALVSYGVDAANHSINTVFVSDNFGILHMVNTGEPSSDTTSTNLANTGGSELFAFIPHELLTNAFEISQFPQSVLTGHYVYGLDGTWVPWKMDDTGGNVDPAAGDRVYLYGNMRRGGKNYYALDVTTVRNDVPPSGVQPKMMWAIQGGVTSTAYANMGQSWSEPAPRSVRWNGQRRRVVFFAGGYDEALHDTVQQYTNTTQLGSQLYMVDALTGDLLWKASSDASGIGVNTVVPDMKYSITATPITMDRNGDSYVDGLIIVDLAGQVFRFDFNEDATSGADFVAHSNAAVLIAKLGATATGASPTVDNRRFFDYPAVGFVPGLSGGNDLIIALTSGYRENPYNNVTKEELFVFRDVGAWSTSPPVNAPVTKADLSFVDLTSSTSLADTTKVGWYGDFNQALGERGVGSPVLYDYTLIFPTFVPVSGGVASACTPDVGYSNLYALNLLTGQGVVNTAMAADPGNPRYLEAVSPGIGSTPQLLLINGSMDVLASTYVTNAVNLGLDPTNLGTVHRSRWYEVPQ